MPDEKKDVLEFPLEELEIPQAIVLMMQAAAKCVSAEIEPNGYEARANVDLECLQQDGDTLNVRGVLYQKACNKKVYDDGVSEVTYCIKQFGHSSIICEDRF